MRSVKAVADFEKAGTHAGDDEDGNVPSPARLVANSIGAA